MVRAMEYAYPHCGYGGITDQYLLGDLILVAPVLKKGQRRRKVRIPTGKWRLGDKIYSNETVTLPCPVDTLLYFERID